MTLSELIKLVENKLAYLIQHRAAAFDRGDADMVTKFDDQILDTQDTLNQLYTLLPL